MARLSADQISMIRRLRREGWTLMRIVNRFGISYPTAAKYSKKEGGES